MVTCSILTPSFPDRLTAKGLMEYLMCEENNILDVVHLDQDNDMNQPMNHYFVNSSHNTYLTGAGEGERRERERGGRGEGGWGRERGGRVCKKERVCDESEIRWCVKEWWRVGRRKWREMGCKEGK